MTAKIYFLCGVSGSGKSTLRKKIEGLNLDMVKIPISYTTRLQRPGEKDGVDYHFLSKEEFYRAVENGEFLEFALVHNMNHYGTKIADVIDNGIQKGYRVIKEIDLAGIKELQKLHPNLRDDYKIVFLDFPKESLIDRINKRGAPISNIELQNRIKSSELESEELGKYADYIIDATKTESEMLSAFLNIIKN